MSFIESSYVTKYFSFRFFLLLPFENVKTNLGSLGCTKVFIGQFWPAGYSLQTCDLYKHSCPYIYKRWRQNFFPLWLAVIQIKLIFFFFFFKNNVYSPSSDYFSFFFFIYLFFFYLWWILSYIEMKQPRVYMCSPSQSPWLLFKNNLWALEKTKIH